jgi:hypothetical protein
MSDRKSKRRVGHKRPAPSDRIPPAPAPDVDERDTEEES